MSKKELVLKAFHNEPVERIPVGFWFHFLDDQEMNMGLDFPELLDKVVEGHKQFRDEFDPDFVKMMTDGLFFRPRSSYPRFMNSVEQLYEIKPLPRNHRYFDECVRQAKRVREVFGDDTLVFYNVFSPLFNLCNALTNSVDPSKVLTFLMEDPDAVVYALNVIADDLCYLLDRIFMEAGMDGLYLSVTNSGRVIPDHLYTKYIAPSEHKMIAKAREYHEDNILHICGWRGRTNILSVYRDYETTVFNWAVHEEGMGLAEGKEYFHGKCVIGGFDQMPGSTIHCGTKEEIQGIVEKMITDGGKVGVIIGADCTVPNGTPIQNLVWAREKAAELS